MVTQPDAINFAALPAVTKAKIRLLRKRGALAVYVRLTRRGYSVGVDDAPGWALVVGPEKAVTR